MLRKIETGVHINRIIIFVEVRQRVKEVQMVGRHAGFDLAACIIQILFFRYAQGFPYILFKGTLATGHWSNPEVSAAFNKIQQHLFMITAQAKYSFPIVTLKFCYQVNTAGRIRTTIDQVAQKYQHVGSLFAWKHFEQAMKLGTTAMDIADDKGFHAGVS